MKNQEKTFSVKKLLLTILCTVIISVSIGSTLLFIYMVPQRIQLEVINVMEKDSETLIGIGKHYKRAYDSIEEDFKKDKALYGEDYPAEELLLLQWTNYFSTEVIMRVYPLSLLIGIGLGFIIYIVAVQNARGKKAIIELVVAFVIIFLLIMLANLAYQTIINKTINSLQPTDVKYYTYIYDLQNNKLIILYSIAAVVIYIGNIIRQKILTNKLNKALNKK